MTFDGWNDELCHHGIKGQKWGVRRYYNADGSLTSEGKQRYRVLYGRELKTVNRNERYIKAYQKHKDGFLAKYDPGTRLGMKLAKRRAERKSDVNESILAGTYRKEKYLNESGKGLNEKGLRTVERLATKRTFSGSGKNLRKAANIIRAALENSGKMNELRKIKDIEKRDEQTIKEIKRILGKVARKKDAFGDPVGIMVSNPITNRIMYEVEKGIPEDRLREAKKRHYY